MEDGVNGITIAEMREGLSEVTRDEFYREIGPQNVTASIVNDRWPYTSVFRTPSREIRGMIVGFLPEGSASEQKCFLLPRKA